MNLFETVKAAVTPRMAAERYGLPIQQGGMVCCPFHADRTPSMKLNEDYFYCFGCGATGDVIDLAARLFDLSKYEAVQKLAADFGILQDWKEHCAPQSPEDPIDPRYAEACHMLERIGNMLDILACGTPKERAEVVADLQKDDRLMRMEARNRQIREDEHGTK